MKRNSTPGENNSLSRDLVKKQGIKYSENPWWFKAVSLLVVLGIVGFGIFGAVQANRVPAEVAETVPLLSYQHESGYDYTVYVMPSHIFGVAPEYPEPRSEPQTYFRDIIKSINVQFNYAFLPDGQVGGGYADVDIVAIVDGPNDWTKEVVLKSAEDKGERFSVDFTLRLDEINDMINEIENELGLRRTEYLGENAFDMVVEARVEVHAMIGSRWITDTYVLPMALDIGKETIEWDDDLSKSVRGIDGGFSYGPQGSFSYTVRLWENSLYGEDVLSIGVAPHDWPERVGTDPGQVYFNKIIDVMLANFNYEFLCDESLTDFSEEVEVTAVLKYPEVWEKTFILVPKMRLTGPVNVNFAMDIHRFRLLCNIIQNEISLGPPTNELSIVAEVHTVGDSPAGRINEVYTHELIGTIGATSLIWDRELTKVQKGAITGTRMVPNIQEVFGINVSQAKVLFPMLAVIFSLLAVYLLIIIFIYKPLPLSALDKQAQQAKKKHKGLIVDVEELPDIAERELNVIALSSLSELADAAETLFKPVLHKAGKARHIYYVLDGKTLYQYVSELLIK